MPYFVRTSSATTYDVAAAFVVFPGVHCALPGTTAAIVVITPSAMSSVGREALLILVYDELKSFHLERTHSRAAGRKAQGNINRRKGIGQQTPHMRAAARSMASKFQKGVPKKKNGLEFNLADGDSASPPTWPHSRGGATTVCQESHAYSLYHVRAGLMTRVLLYLHTGIHRYACPKQGGIRAESAQVWSSLR